MATGKRKKKKSIKPAAETVKEDKDESEDQEETETEEGAEDTDEEAEVTEEEKSAESELAEKKSPAELAIAVDFPAHVPTKVVVKLNNGRKLILDRVEFSALCLKLSSQS